MISLSFEAQVWTHYGQSVRLVGNLPSLGDWAPALGLDLITDSSIYPKWRSPKEISAPDGLDLEFKLVIMNNSFEVSRWENLHQNRTYTTNSSQEKMLLRFTVDYPHIDEIYIGSAIQEGNLHVLANYTKLLSKHKIHGYPIIKEDQEYYNYKLFPLEEVDADLIGEQIPIVNQEEVTNPDSSSAQLSQNYEQNEQGTYDLSGRIGYFYREQLQETSSILTASSHQKATRLKNELKQLAKCLPVSSSNSIFVHYDEVRLDVMRALIFGSEYTPYSHGAYIFDIFIPDDYPQQPPKVSIVSTKGEKIRFNPNLYADGLVCLSLLGTWEGSSSESWDPVNSNIYQVLVSIQSLVMNEDVYFNEPYYEDSKGTPMGDECNRAYSNIVKFYNVSHAICDMIERPPPEFKEVIALHFYLKRDVIRETVQNWIQEAEKKEACLYDELICDHNQEISSLFSEDPDKYIKDLKAEMERMEILLQQLEKRIPS